MRYTRLSTIFLCFVLFTAMFGVFSATPVNAQSTNISDSRGLEISPTVIELNATRENTYNLTIKVKNVTVSDLVYSTEVNDFSSAGETGAPQVIVDSTLPATSSIISWIVAVPEFTLKSHEESKINVQVIIPNDAEPGGHYGVIRFSGSAPELQDSGVGLSASSGVLLLIRVDGIITEKASLASFYTELNDKQSSFFENSPIKFVTRVKNEGNIHIKPIGNIELHDMFGNIVTTLTVGDTQSNVLPNSTRRFEAQYSNMWMIGRYTANLTLGYGTTGQAIANTISFWVIPYKVILAGLLVLATIIYILSRMIKVYNRHIINKAKNEDSIKHKKHKKTKG